MTVLMRILIALAVFSAPVYASTEARTVTETWDSYANYSTTCTSDCNIEEDLTWYYSWGGTYDTVNTFDLVNAVVNVSYWRASGYSASCYAQASITGSGDGWVTIHVWYYGTVPNGSCGFSWTGGDLTVHYNALVHVPVNVSVTGIPSDWNYGVLKTLVARWTDDNGASTMNSVLLLIGNTANTSNAYRCQVNFQPGWNRLYLSHPNGGGWIGYITVGSGSLDNGWCYLSGANTSFSISGNTLTVSIAVSMYPSMLAHGPLNYYLSAQDTTGNSSGWSGSFGTTALRSGPKLIVTSNH
jgi:hypothetical protein